MEYYSKHTCTVYLVVGIWNWIWKFKVISWLTGSQKSVCWAYMAKLQALCFAYTFIVFWESWHKKSIDPIQFICWCRIPRPPFAVCSVTFVASAIVYQILCHLLLLNVSGTSNTCQSMLEQHYNHVRAMKSVLSICWVEQYFEAGIVPCWLKEVMNFLVSAKICVLFANGQVCVLHQICHASLSIWVVLQTFLAELSYFRLCLGICCQPCFAVCSLLCI